MPSLYQRAQGLLVSLDDEEIFSYTVPSKVQGYLAAGRPIIAAINGEAANIIQDSGAGLICMAEDTSALADNIRKLYHLTPEQRTEMGAQGYKYFNEHFEMESQIRRLVEILHHAGQRHVPLFFRPYGAWNIRNPQKPA
jgi:glycosyltransferase involved in cell wall biosynthesis